MAVDSSPCSAGSEGLRYTLVNWSAAQWPQPVAVAVPLQHTPYRHRPLSPNAPPCVLLRALAQPAARLRPDFLLRAAAYGQADVAAALQ